ncbi:hypothetical protein EVAR_5821_1 [Eumeta japonica]|uniref:Uncharacterized protein n=1 Tax=Eumeta variegata TaxID=151549 RepID=A0A4C1T7E9_EUMVA|nr:hypothetical protein EVAR_5821_1 [Eumeta japonica]
MTLKKYLQQEKGLYKGSHSIFESRSRLGKSLVRFSERNLFCGRIGANVVTNAVTISTHDAFAFALFWRDNKYSKYVSTLLALRYCLLMDQVSEQPEYGLR